MSADGAEWPWSVLGLDGQPDDPREVKRAYARLLKERDWSSDAAGFQALRHAYEAALSWSGGAREARRPIMIRPTATQDEARLDAQPVTQEEPFFDIKAVTQPEPPHDSAPEAQAEPAPPPKPSPWGETGPEVLLSRAAKLLEARNLNPAEWQAIMASKHLQEPDLRHQIEAEILYFLEDMQRETGDMRLPAAWLLMLDREFQWRADGIAFQRRFPFYSHSDLLTFLLIALREADGQNKPAAHQQAPRKPLLRRWWVLAGLTIIFYTAIRGNYYGYDLSSIIAFVMLQIGGAIIFTFIAAMVFAWGRLIFRGLARLSRHLASGLDRLAVWWARPLRGIAKGSITYFLIAMLPILAFSSVISTGDPTGRRVSDHNSRLEASKVGLDFGVSRNQMLRSDYTLERYPLFYGWETDEGAKPRPLAMLYCDRANSGACHLSITAPLNARRSIALDPGQEDAGLEATRGEDAELSHAKLLLNQTMDGRLTAQDRLYGLAASLSQRRPPEDGGGAFLLRISSAFVGVLETAQGDFPLPRGETVELPVETLSQPLAMRLDWPEDFRAGSSCTAMIHGVGLVDDPRCAELRAMLRPGETLICPPGGDRERCTIHDGPLRSSFGNSDTLVLFQELLRRTATEGPHPSLDDAPGATELRDAVVADYALILDRAEGRERTAETLTDALSRQPQLLVALLRSASEKEEYWQEFVAQMAGLGFTVPE